jgi:hypothetical protein
MPWLAVSLEQSLHARLSCVLGLERAKPPLSWRVLFHGRLDPDGGRRKPHFGKILGLNEWLVALFLVSWPSPLPKLQQPRWQNV